MITTHILSTHPINQPYQHTLSTHPVNPLPPSHPPSQDASHVEWLFPPPRQVSFPGSFQEGRTIARYGDDNTLITLLQHSLRYHPLIQTTNPFDMLTPNTLLSLSSVLFLLSPVSYLLSSVFPCTIDR